MHMILIVPCPVSLAAIETGGMLWPRHHDPQANVSPAGTAFGIAKQHHLQACGAVEARTEKREALMILRVADEVGFIGSGHAREAERTFFGSGVSAPCACECHAL
jgi:hypothetical protein